MNLRSILFLVACAFGVVGCQTPAVHSTPPETARSAEPEVQVLREGDVIRIAFPASPNLDTSQQIRRDGRITLALVGEMRVAGLTPAQLEQELIQKYENQLVSKEVSVSVVSSSYAVFVSGAVRSPGKIQLDRPVTALEAVMEAGGFVRATANPRAVVVIRNEGGQMKRFVLDLQRILDGQETQPFYLKPSDIVDVPERFSWF